MGQGNMGGIINNSPNINRNNLNNQNYNYQNNGSDYTNNVNYRNVPNNQNINNISSNNYVNYQNSMNNLNYNNSNNQNIYNNQNTNYNYNGYNIQNNQNSYQNDNYESKLKNDKVNNKLNKEKKKFNIKNFSFSKIVIIILIIIIIIFLIFIGKNLLKSYSLHVYLNGADIVDEMNMKCKSNIKGECSLTLPIAKRYDGEILGYSTNKYAKDAEYQIGEKIEMANDLDLYVISRKENKLIIDKSDIDEIHEDASCVIYNEEKSCDVTVPMFNKKGYKLIGYSINKNSTSNVIKFGTKYSLNNDINLYPVYDELSVDDAKMHFKIERSVYIYNTYLDIGYGCDTNIANSLINNLKTLYEKFPFYAYYSKITLLSDKEFNSIAGSSEYYGLTNNLEIDDNPTVLIRCSEDIPIYPTAVHELTHALDIRYEKKHGHYINEENDVIELRKKYINSSNRPLRSYAYGDRYSMLVPEFFAELITFYYINYVDTTTKLHTEYYRGNYPDDMKKIAEKYICIGKNNFDASKCN